MRRALLHQRVVARRHFSSLPGPPKAGFTKNSVQKFSATHAKLQTDVDEFPASKSAVKEYADHQKQKRALPATEDAPW
jgi:hypothetical protein